jgi:cytochrome c553
MRRLAALIAAAGAALAAGATPAAPPDLAGGRQIAAVGTPGGAAACATCHGLDGAGDPGGVYPRLAGQGAFYLYKQLVDFRSGRRESQIMAPIAKAMSDVEMQNAAGYYAAARAPYAPPPFADGALLQRGGVLAAAGSAERNVPACVNCHGRFGAGVPPSFPSLAGQFARYTGDQLAAWKSGARRNDPLDVMRDIAARLDERDIAAIAAYFERARPASTAFSGGG